MQSMLEAQTVDPKIEKAASGAQSAATSF